MITDLKIDDLGILESSEHLSVVTFSRKGLCSCVRQRVQVERAADYFTNQDFRVRFYSIKVDDPEILDALLDLEEGLEDVRTPRTIYVFLGNIWGAEEGLRSGTKIIDNIFSVISQIKEHLGVTL